MRVGGIGDAEDVIYGIIAVLVLHQRAAAARKCHVLQTLTLLVVSIGSLGTIAELLIDGMSVLVVAYLCHDGTLLALLAARQALHLSGGVVVVGDDLTVGIGHRLHTVPAVVGGTIDIGADVRHARHDGAHGLGDLSLTAIVVGLTARGILHEGKPSGTVILVARLLLRYLINVQNDYIHCFKCTSIDRPFLNFTTILKGDGKPYLYLTRRGTFILPALIGPIPLFISSTN